MINYSYFERSFRSMLRGATLLLVLIATFFMGLFSLKAIKTAEYKPEAPVTLTDFRYTTDYAKAKVNDLSNYRLSVASGRSINDKATV